MSRLPVNEPTKEIKDATLSTSVMTERNRLMSWEKPVQELTKPAMVIQIPRNAINLKSLDFVSKVTKLIHANLVKLPYTLFRLGYEIAKLVIRGLSSIRRLLFVAE
jgi:hypothetical protein